ncbi:uncharacterized protein LOC101205533 [Cucumis sativus]|uniref:Uncharacterized protein n=1 Tax=Cucumis sativus TaxID=3659 RepID=A0A0A0LUV7_CUCSA|nr:uncharacterized protein LOC101205533 [Cucumis sativus]KGN65518.1 hypothetical protein Csa_019818 [Cucumis sativus]
MKMKMKRKDLDQINDDFSDFSLSSPARKIRRLDVGLPPIIEEEEPPEFSVLSKQPLIPEDFTVGGNGVRIEELSDASSVSPSVYAMEDRPFCDNQERAIVLFKPVNTSFFQSSPLSVSVDSDIISGFKSEFLRENCYDGRVKCGEDDEDMVIENKNLAVVPWVPRLQVPTSSTMNVPQEEEAPQLMEAEEVGEATMEIEEDNNLNNSQQGYGYGGMDGANGIHQWHHQQQHCMIPQLPQQTSSPITWFR